MEEEKITTVLKLMKLLGITLEDLNLYFDIEKTKKFPLPVFYSDQSQSESLAYYKNSKNKMAVGVIINKTFYAFPNHMKTSQDCEMSLRICKQAINKGFSCRLPEYSQMEDLADNLKSYNRISEFLGYGLLDENSTFAIASSENGGFWQKRFKIKNKKTTASNTEVLVLPVMLLKK